MCNLYRNYSSLEEIRRLFRVNRVHPSAGNLAPQSEIYPGYEAPVIRLADDGERELVMMTWGFVLPQQGRSPKWVNNTRDDKVMSSGFWKSSFIERRCLIPASSFAEYHPTVRDEKGHKAVVWFSMTGGSDLPFAFAGIWRHWRGDWKGELREMDCYSMLTTVPNELVRPIHPTRMPVILKPDDYDNWLRAEPADALKLARPFEAGAMTMAIAA